MKKLILCLSFILAAVALKAQDRIHLYTGSIIHCKVLEVGVDVVKYKLDDKPDAVLYSLYRADILKIEFGDGTAKEMEEEGIDAIDYDATKKRAIKIDLLSPAFNYLSMGYEQSIGRRMSLEGTVGFIGIGGLDISDRQPTGANVRVGIKFMKDYYRKDGNKKGRYNVLHGAYIMPSVFYNNFDYNYRGQSPITWEPLEYRANKEMLGLQAMVGRQAVMGNTVALDFFFGFGYNILATSPNNPNEIDIDPTNHYGVVTPPGIGDYILLSAGLKLGLLLK